MPDVHTVDRALSLDVTIRLASIEDLVRDLDDLRSRGLRLPRDPDLLHDGMMVALELRTGNRTNIYFFREICLVRLLPEELLEPLEEIESTWNRFDLRLGAVVGKLLLVLLFGGIGGWIGQDELTLAKNDAHVKGANAVFNLKIATHEATY